MEQAVNYAQLAKNTTEYLSCLHDVAQVGNFVIGYFVIQKIQILF